jgi:hypothetical protein
VRGASLGAACIEFRFEWRRTREMIEFDVNLALILSSCHVASRRRAHTKISAVAWRQENPKNLSRAVAILLLSLSLMQEESTIAVGARNFFAQFNQRHAVKTRIQ